MNIVVLTPKTLTDTFGFYLDPKVLDSLELGDLVRIGVKLEGMSSTDEFYASDSPYVKLVKFSRDKEELCGQITDKNREEADIKYPIRCGEKIWFKRQNIFEIDTQDKARLTKFLNDEHVPVTGKMYAFSDSESESEPEFGSESET